MVCPPLDTVEFEKLFRYEIFKMLKAGGEINPALKSILTIKPTFAIRLIKDSF